MELIEVHRENRRDVRDFLNLPFTIYRDIPQWVPPLMPGEKKRFKPDYSFYHHSEVVFYLLRNENGQAVGRIAGLEHHPHNEYRNHRDALLYLYEAINDDEVAHTLFNAVIDWAQKRKLDTLVGPKGFLTGDGLGLLVDGFEYRPALGIPYNPRYYVRQWEDIGRMEKVVDYLSAMVTRDGFEYPERVRRIAEKIRQRRNYEVPTLKSRADFEAQAERIQKAYNSAFSDLWAYTPVPDVEVSTITDNLMEIADPKLLKLIFKDGELIGFQFAFPDVSAAIQKIRGRLWPFGWLVLLLEKRQTEWLNINGNAILPQYQGLGANAILYDEMIRSLLDNKQFNYADMVQVQESNMRMLADLQELTGAEPHKRHRVYKRRLD